VTGPLASADLCKLIADLSKEENASALRVLANHRQPVVVQGGLTGLAGGATPQAGEHAKQLSAYRETVGELLSKLKPHAAFDIGIPMDRMERFVDDARSSLSERFPQQTHLFFGHLGDGNLHLLSGPYADASNLLEVEELIYAAVSEAEGCISAEHGIGVIKEPFLHYSRSEPEIELMNKLKALLDPTGMLNAGRVFKQRAACT